MKLIYKHKHEDVWFSHNGNKAYLRGEKPKFMWPNDAELEPTNPHHIARNVVSHNPHGFSRTLIMFYREVLEGKEERGMRERTYYKLIYSDGRMVEYNPFFRWRFRDEMFEISTKYDWGIGIMRGWTIGCWTRYKTKFFKIGRYTFYLHYGMTEPYNPQTGEVYNRRVPTNEK